jgi:small subunit ribosomal protein S4e
MARGPKRHVKRIATPAHWMLSKLTGVWAPRPSSGPHKLRECLPMCLVLRNRLKLALNGKEASMIAMQRLVRIDGKIRTDSNFPLGFMDVIALDKTKDNYRMLYDTKGRFVIHKIHKDEAAYKLCRVQKLAKGTKGLNYITTHDGRTIRFPDPAIKVHDTIQVDLETGKAKKHVAFAHGNVCMIMGGNSIGRVGLLVHRERHPGGHEIVHLKDSAGHDFCTRIGNVMVIGEGETPWVTLPKGDGIKLSVIEDRTKRMTK